MAGRPSCVSHEQVFEVLSKYEIFDSQGNIVVTKNDDIWSKAVTDLKDAITIKNLHTRFYGNRNNLREKLKKQALLNKSEPTKSSKPVEPSSKESEEKSSQAKNDTMEALDKLKTEVCLDAVITDISAKPFHVIYVSPDQIDLYKDFVKLYRTPVYFNVHYNLVENAYIDNNEIKDVLLYCLFGVIDGMIIPFFQTLSERCNKNYLSYSIGEFLRKKVPVPHECVTECSLDLLEGICVALNHQGLEDYGENCFEVLIETKKLEEEKKNCSDEEKQKSIEQQLNKMKSTFQLRRP